MPTLLLLPAMLCALTQHVLPPPPPLLLLLLVHHLACSHKPLSRTLEGHGVLRELCQPTFPRGGS